jgi:hypothetical protein
VPIRRGARCSAALPQPIRVGRDGWRRDGLLLPKAGADSFEAADLTGSNWAHLHRLPVGEDFALRARGSIGPDGIGVTTAEVFDRDGFVATSAQTLLVQRRL